MSEKPKSDWSGKGHDRRASGTGRLAARSRASRARPSCGPRCRTDEPEVDECIRVSIHGHVHYLHSTTARELEKMSAMP